MKKRRETENLPILLVTEHISDELAGKYFDEGINVLDKSGNCKISNGDLFISVSGRKSKTDDPGRKIKAMSDTEIRLTFHLLAKEGLVGETSLPQGMSWGGDCGANIIDGYLIPGSYEIYSSVPATSLLATGKVSNTQGEIKVYSKFWKEDGSRTAPLLIIYADLMGSGDSRCIDAAQRLKQNGI